MEYEAIQIANASGYDIILGSNAQVLDGEAHFTPDQFLEQMDTIIFDGQKVLILPEAIFPHSESFFESMKHGLAYLFRRKPSE